MKNKANSLVPFAERGSLAVIFSIAIDAFMAISKSPSHSRT